MRYVLALAVLLGTVIYWQSPTVLVNSNTTVDQPSNQVVFKQTAVVNNPEFTEGEGERLRIQFQQQAEQFKALFKQAQQNKQGNIQPWLEKVWHQCSLNGEAGCQEFLKSLAEFLTKEEQQWLAQALESFGQYYAEMTEMTLSNDMTAQQRFASIEHIRAKHFSEQTNAVFGLEHAYAEYQFDYDYLRTVEAAQLTVEQRLEALDKLREKAQLGDSKKELLGPDKAYQEALSLLQDLPEEERQKWQAQLREKYFADEAAEVAAYEQRQQQQQQQQLTYQQALEALKQHADSLGGINSPQYQQELQALRQQLFN